MVAETDEGPVWTGKIDWLGKSDRSVDEVMIAIGEGEVGMDGMSATDEAAGWLEDYLNSVGGSKALHRLSRLPAPKRVTKTHPQASRGEAQDPLRVRGLSEDHRLDTARGTPACSRGGRLLETQITVPTVPTTSHTHTSYTPSPPSTGPRSGNSSGQWFNSPGDRADCGPDRRCGGMTPRRPAEHPSPVPPYAARGARDGPTSPGTGQKIGR